MTIFKRSMVLPALFFAFSGQALSEEAKTEAMDAVEATSATSACEMPAAPIIPDGNVASEDELVAAQKAMKMFQGNLLDYRDCIHEAEKQIDLDSETAEAEGEELLNSYNISVDAEEKNATEFNAAVKAFKARQQ